MDITLCTGENCPVKEKCHRFQPNNVSLYQSYFVNPPITKNKDGNLECQMYWEENTQGIWDTLSHAFHGGKLEDVE